MPPFDSSSTWGRKATPAADPLRRGPIAVEILLEDWLPRKTILAPDRPDQPTAGSSGSADDRQALRHGSRGEISIERRELRIQVYREIQV